MQVILSCKVRLLRIQNTAFNLESNWPRASSEELIIFPVMTHFPKRGSAVSTSSPNPAKNFLGGKIYPCIHCKDKQVDRSRYGTPITCVYHSALEKSAYPRSAQLRGRNVCTWGIL